ncbi:MAG: hypothetical protein WCZ23_11695 [Rhodospirillaceae bacterium]
MIPQTEDPIIVIDLPAIEREAHRLRAEAFHGLLVSAARAVGRMTAHLFHHGRTPAHS